MSAELLPAIAAEPDDDLPRLVYADWLDEHADPDRAEFIRLQCHTARVGPLDPTWAPYKLRELELFRANEPRWRPATAGGESRILMARWRRGFPTSVMLDDVTDGRLTSGEWCNGSFNFHAREPGRGFSARRDPWPAVVKAVRSVSVSGWGRGSEGLFHHERLRTVRSITLSEWYARVSVERLEHFLHEFARLPAGHFPELTTLHLDQGELTLGALNTLANSWALSTITRLSVRFPDDVRADDPQAWVQAAFWLFTRFAPHAERLELTGLPPFLIPWFGQVRWPRLRELRVRQQFRDGLDGYFASDTPNLRTLLVEHRAHALTQVPWLPAANDAFINWPALDTVRVASLGGMTGPMLRRLKAERPTLRFEFLTAFPVPNDPDPIRLTELNDIPATRGLRGLSGSFTAADLAPLADPGVLPELHTIWAGYAEQPAPLPWRGGTRTVISDDPPVASLRRPSRSSWLAWAADLG